MNQRETALTAAIMAAHRKMSDYEGASRITQSNADTVAKCLRDTDPSGYLSEILRVGRQALLLADLAKDAHDALVSALDLAISQRST